MEEATVVAVVDAQVVDALIEVNNSLAFTNAALCALIGALVGVAVLVVIVEIFNDR